MARFTDVKAAREMKANLLEFFPEMEGSRYLNDIVRLGVFLKAGPRHPSFSKGLQSLENGISDAVITRIHSRWDLKEGAQDVLRAHLRDTEIQDGFATPDRAPVFMGFVTHGPFLDAIKDGMHWEDLGAGSGHGRYTHRIQWYLAARAGVLRRKNTSLVFKELGKYFTKNPGEGGSEVVVNAVSEFTDTINGLSAWDIVCDRFGKKPGADMGSNKEDFRSPEYMHAWLQSSENNHPKVRAIISGLSVHHPDQATRAKEGFGSAKSMADVYAMRVYGKTANQMGDEFKNAFDKYYEETKFGRSTGILSFDSKGSTASPIFDVPPKPGGSKCYITTATCEHLNTGDCCEELQELRKFRDAVMLSSREGGAEVEAYYKLAPVIVDALSHRSDAPGIYAYLFRNYIRPSVRLLQMGDLAGAHLTYRQMVLDTTALRLLV